MKFFLLISLYFIPLLSFTQDRQQADSILQLIKKKEAAGKYDKELFDWYFQLWKIDCTFSYELALEDAKKALNVAEKIRHQYGIAASYGALAESYLYLDFYYLALENAQKSYRLHMDGGYQDSAGYVLIDLGNAYFNFKQYELAFEFYKRAEAAFQKSGDYQGLSVTCNNFGLIKSEQGQHDSALIYFLRGLDFRKKLDMPCVLAHSYNYLGQEYLALGDLKRAMSYFKKAEKPFIQNRCQGHDLFIFFTTCLGMADIYIMQKHFILARQYADKALALAAGPIDSRLLRARSYQKFSNLFQAQKQYDLAAGYLHKSIATADTLKSLPLKRTCYQMMAALYEESKKSDSALKYLRLFNRYNDSIHSALVTDKLSEIRRAVDLFEKENKIKIQESQLQASRLQAKNEEFQKWISLIGFLVMLVSGTIIFAEYRTNKKINRQLMMQNKEISERKEQINKFSEELQRANAAKDKLFSIIGHDLKNPFRALLSFSNILTEDIRNKDFEKAESHSQIISSSGRQAYLVLENLLEWTRMQYGQIEFHPAEVEVDKVIDENIALLSGNAMSKHIAILKETDNPVAFADHNMLNTVLRNLLSNAINFTSENGKITITARHKNSKVEISVADNGIGIEKNDLEKLLRDDIPTREVAVSAKGKGTGLGLLLCKDFIRKNDGTLDIRSEMGKGSIFTFTVPLSKNYQPKETRIEQVSGVKSIQLNEQDKKYLFPFVERFKRLEIYEASELKLLLDEIDVNKSDSIRHWKKEMENAVFISAEKIFRELLNAVSSG